MTFTRKAESTVTVTRMNPTSAATMTAHVSRNFVRQTLFRRTRARSMSATSCWFAACAAGSGLTDRPDVDALTGLRKEERARTTSRPGAKRSSL